MEHPEKIPVPYYIKKTQELTNRNSKIADDFKTLASSVKHWPEELFNEYNRNISIMELLKIKQPLIEEE